MALQLAREERVQKVSVQPADEGGSQRSPTWARARLASLELRREIDRRTIRPALPIDLAITVMVAIVRSFGFPAAELQNLRRVPSTDELRPVQCPSCSMAAGSPGAFRIVGHGLYRRQLLGLPDAPEGLVIFVRRFLCLACQKTASILPDEVHPRRWYAGSAILVALVGYLIHGVSAARVRAEIGAATGSRGWKSLERWRTQLLNSLWFWKGAELGHAAAVVGGGTSRPHSTRLLRRLLNHLGATDPYPPDDCVAVARNAVIGTIHGWPERALIGRTP